MKMPDRYVTKIVVECQKTGCHKFNYRIIADWKHEDNFCDNCGEWMTINEETSETVEEEFK
jgi:hypothetical protein